MLVGVLALQGDFAEHRAALSDLEVETRQVRLPEDLAGVDGLILPGGESTTMSLLLESSGLHDPIRKELEAGLPAFGTCAGMILLARSLVDARPDQRTFASIDIDIRRNGFGRQLDSFESDVEVATLGPEPLHAVFIRAPIVERIGSEVEVLATLPSPGDKGKGDESGTPVLCRQGPVLVSAFHPELTRDRRLHRYFVSIIEKRGR